MGSHLISHHTKTLSLRTSQPLVVSPRLCLSSQYTFSTDIHALPTCVCTHPCHTTHSLLIPAHAAAPRIHTRTLKLMHALRLHTSTFTAKHLSIHHTYPSFPSHHLFLTHSHTYRLTCSASFVKDIYSEHTACVPTHGFHVDTPKYRSFR